MLNLLDFILSSIMLAFLISGLYKGAIILILGNISFLASILLSSLLFPSAYEVVSEHVTSTILAKVIASCVAYIISLIICSILFGKIKKLIKPICGGLFDKSLGGLLGCANGVILNLCIFLAISMLFSPKAIYQHDNLYTFIQSLEKSSYPKWAKDANSFSIAHQTLEASIKIPFVKQLLQQIDFNYQEQKQQSFESKEALKQQINNLLEEHE